MTSNQRQAARISVAREREKRPLFEAACCHELLFLTDVSCS